MQYQTDKLSSALPRDPAKTLAAEPAMTRGKYRPRVKKPQPVDLLQVPGARLRMELVHQLVGLAPSTIYTKMARGEFPQPVRSSSRCSRWISDDIRAYLAQQ